MGNKQKMQRNLQIPTASGMYHDGIEFVKKTIIAYEKYVSVGRATLPDFEVKECKRFNIMVQPLTFSAQCFVAILISVHRANIKTKQG